MSEEIQVGDVVRSFDQYGPVSDEVAADLTGEDACYVVGVVEGIREPGSGQRPSQLDDCSRYESRVVSRIVRGTPSPIGSSHVYPPLNGTESLMGTVMDGVKLVVRDKYVGKGLVEVARARFEREVGLFQTGRGDQHLGPRMVL